MQVYGICIRTLHFPVIVRRQISAPSVPSCVCANDLSFKICVFQVVRVHTAVETTVTATVVM